MLQLYALQIFPTTGHNFDVKSFIGL